MTAEFDAAALRALAEKATPGPWLCTPWQPTDVMPKAWAEDRLPAGDRGQFMAISVSGTIGDRERVQQKADAAFIALANPATVLAMLDENADLRARAEAAEAAVARVQALIANLPDVIRDDDYEEDLVAVHIRVASVRRAIDGGDPR